jgi:CPA1 family monovalent cation:H+ antiporter
VFLLVGQQIAAVIRGLRAYPVGTIVTAVIVSLGVVLLLRPLWLILTQSLPHTLHVRRGRAASHDDAHLSGREVVVLSWAGTRGVISLAAIFTLPLVVSGGAPFPKRDLLLFCTYVVVVVTLVVQGITFAPLARALGVRADPADAVQLRAEARAAGVKAARARLDQIASDRAAPEPALASLRASLDRKTRRYQQLLDRLETMEDDDAGPPSPPGYEAAVQARRAVIDAQREELLRWRDAGHLPDSSLRILERELDHEERTLPPHDDH